MVRLPCKQMKGPSRLMRNTLRHSSRSVSHTVLLIPAIPALLTRMSILPNALSVASFVFSTAARSETSTLNAVTPSPISLAVFSANGWSWSQIATLAPELTKRSVMARPNPWAPPVTTAQRPFRSILFMVRVLSFTDPHGEERAVARVSNHESNAFPILRDAAKAPLLQRQRRSRCAGDEVLPFTSSSRHR